MTTFMMTPQSTSTKCDTVAPHNVVAAIGLPLTVNMTANMSVRETWDQAEAGNDNNDNPSLLNDSVYK